MTTKLDRRSLLQGGAALALVTGTQFFTGIPALANYAAGPALRRNASTMNASDPILRGYRRAIQAMRALPDDNPCSWFYQAAIHGTTDGRNLTAWNTCHTDPDFFWAWHRMYLYWFERIVRKYSGMYDWALPYWDWTNPAERAVPAPFRQVGNALYDPSRNASINAGGELSTNLATSVNNAMGLLNYFSAQSGVDGPHGSVHGAVGGNMCCVVTAAQDPIFWLHHSFIDMLWNLWLAQGNGRSSPVGDATWRNSTYTFFDECCNEVSMDGCDVLRAAQQLSYAYEGEPPQVNQYCPPVWTFDPSILEILTIARWRGPFMVRNKPARYQFEPGTDNESAERRLDDVIRSREQHAILRLQGIEADIQPGVSWEVYLGAPGVKPDPKGPQFLGMFGLFSSGIRTREHHYSPGNLVFAAEKALRAVRNMQEIEVLLVPVSGLETEEKTQQSFEVAAPISIQQISIGVDVALPNPPKEEQDELRRQEEIE